MSTVSAPASVDKTSPAACPAAAMTPEQRLALARQALPPQANRAQIARDHDVSRPFLYQQLHRAQQALERAFTPPQQQPDVLFYLPITRAWLHMFVLVLHLICRASYRNIRRAMQLLLDTSISMGSIHNLIQRTADDVQQLHEHEPLHLIEVGAHDEIFHAHQPIFSGVDVPSGYCYLLQRHEQCDGDTWGVVLLELQDRGLALRQVVGDGGKGLRAGHREAGYGEVDYDHFHLLAAAGEMVRYLHNRARRAEITRQRLQRKMARAAAQGKQGRYSAKLGAARQKAEAAALLHEEVACLVRWLGEDVLQPSGLAPQARRELYEWIARELAGREGQCSHRIRPVRRLLESFADEVLAFSRRLADELEAVRRGHQLKREELEAVVELAQLEDVSQYWRRWSALRGRVGEGLDAVVEAVKQVLAGVVRASSEVESFHTRLRRSFRQRRHVDQRYLEVQRFVLNHSRLERSRVPGRQGRSPAEVLQGKELPHWLEQLGYTLFQRAA